MPARTHVRAHTRALTRTRAHAFPHTCAYTLTHMCTHTAVAASPPYRLSLFGGAQSTVTARSACDNAGRWPFKSTHELATRFTRGFGSFSRIKKLLGRTETRTHYRMYCQTIRIDVSRDDRAKIATNSLRTLTDRLKENYSIELYRRVPVQRAVERDEIPYPYKVHDTTLRPLLNITKNRP